MLERKLPAIKTRNKTNHINALAIDVYNKQYEWYYDDIGL